MNCAYCPNEATTVDHVVPCSRGGDDSPENKVPACAHCNSSKGGKLPSEWRVGLSPEVLRTEDAALKRCPAQRRPYYPSSEARDIAIKVWLTSHEREQLRTFATAANISMSDYVRLRILGRE